MVDKDLEIFMLKELLKNLLSIRVKMQLAKYFIDQDYSVNKISSYNWYYYCKVEIADQRKLNKGCPCNNKAINIEGEIVDNNFIVEALKKHRQQKFLSNRGGVKKLRYYLKRDYGLIVNH